MTILMGTVNIRLSQHREENSGKSMESSLEIPYGQLTTYGDIAKEVAKRMGRRNVSPSCWRLLAIILSIIIPCHRVVGKSGSLTAFGSGIETKVKLLEHEG